MNRETLIQVGVLYGPLVMAGLLTVWLRPGRRLAIGLLFSTVWQAAMLPWFDLTARALGCWSYEASGPALAGIPLSLYFGWVIAWGWLAPLAATAAGRHWPLVLAALLAIDLWLMPQFEPVLQLADGWWLADLALFAGLLLPGLMLCRWTHEDQRLEGRVALLVGCFGGLLLGLPLLACHPESGVSAMLARAIRQPLWIAAALLLALPGLAAMRDLARSGKGTPVPIDPTSKLVSHGVYGFVANPMQLSMTLLLLLESWYLGSFWPLVVAGLGIIYSEGFARWSEGQDLKDRFGSTWMEYRARVRPWLPRWRPAVLDDCELWVNLDCGPCVSVGRWFEARRPVGLKLRNAGDWAGDPMERLTWRHPGSGRCETGVGAIAMALQHLSLPWAMAGLIAGAPVLRPVLQCCFDAAGLGPRKVCTAETG